MNKKQIIQKTINHVKAELSNDSSGHDWWHVYRVWKNAKHIGRQEKTDMFIVELAALLHDIADYKFHPEGSDIAVADKIIDELDVDGKTKLKVNEIINHIFN